MALDQTVINSAINKKYSEFSDAIKNELHSKTASHPESKKYASDYDKVQDMKSMFAKINSTEE